MGSYLWIRRSNQWFEWQVVYYERERRAKRRLMPPTRLKRQDLSRGYPATFSRQPRSTRPGLAGGHESAQSFHHRSFSGLKQLPSILLGFWSSFFDPSPSYPTVEHCPDICILSRELSCAPAASTSSSFIIHLHRSPSTNTTTSTDTT